VDGVLAVIPARGGSVRIPRKNVRPFLGRPLIERTIQAALGSGCVDLVVVSTDDPEIAEVAVEAGAAVPFLRPSPLADDHAPASAATEHAVEELALQGQRFAHVAQLMANCPLRTAEDVRASYAAFRERPEVPQLSVMKFASGSAWWAAELHEGEMEFVFADRISQRSQDLPRLVCPTGAVWWTSTAELAARHGFYGGPVRGWEIPWERGIDIDDETDWLLAEALAVVPG
jgi:CMP-N-acetylneuraminic acid synthetase